MILFILLSLPIIWAVWFDNVVLINLYPDGRFPTVLATILTLFPLLTPILITPVFLLKVTPCTTFPSASKGLNGNSFVVLLLTFSKVPTKATVSTLSTALWGPDTDTFSEVNCSFCL